MRNLEKVKNIIVKIGSSSLCDQNGNIDKEKILNLIQQIAYIKRKNIKITLVSSGAINAGVHIMNLKQLLNVDNNKVTALNCDDIYKQIYNIDISTIKELKF